jgi:RND superfamily putative drug exporter
VIVGWLAALVMFSFLGRAVGSQFKDSINGGNSESQRAANFLSRSFPSQAGDTAEIVFTSPTGLESPANEPRINEALARVASLQHVLNVASPFGPGGTRQIDTHHQIGFAVVQFDRAGDALPKYAIQQVVTVADSARASGLDVHLTGTPIQRVENPKFGASETLGILAAIIILLLAFGSVIAMLLPILSAVVGVAATFGILDLLSHNLTVPSFGPELAALVGLGVGIDYALFVVTRYRGALSSGATPELAVITAMTTSGRSVLFAGSTVVLSLLGLFLLGLPFIYGASLGAVTAVLLVMAASLTLLPAALGFAGRNIDRLHVGRRRSPAAEAATPSIWWRWSRKVQRRPALAGGAALAVLAVLAVPFLSLHLAFTDAGTDPTSYTSRQAFDALAKGFGPGASGPLVVAAKIPAGANTAAVSALESRLQGLPDVESVSAPRFNESGSAAVITVIPATAPQDSRTSTLVSRIRHDVVPQATANSDVRAVVGGETAASIDTTKTISRHLPLVISFVVLLAVLLLIVAFRSIVIPLASALMTLISTGAAYGVIVAVFQWGWLGSGIDNGATAPVDPWVPVMLFALLFGLSMDYQVFLVSRIREAYRSGHGDSEAVANGLASTGRVITSAAAIMICVFVAFVFGDLRALRLFGFAMASAILLDATLVRMVLMPATMQLLGRSNWWFPRKLERSIPNLLSEDESELQRAGLQAAR